jgi:hypothetical protein
MSKVCVIVQTPAIGREDDMLLPDYLPIGQLKKLIGDAIKELSNGAFVPTGQELLCRREDGIILHPRYTLGDYGTTDGMHLMLF